MATLAEQWIAEGRVEGRGEGLIEGQIKTILAFFRKRFGAVPQTLEERLQAASPDELDGWVDRTLAARSIDEALNGAAPGENGSSK